MSDGVIVQCARADRLDASFTTTHSSQANCVRCHQPVWLCPASVELARSEGIKPLCDVCQPAIQVELGNIHDAD